MCTHFLYTLIFYKSALIFYIMRKSDFWAFPHGSNFRPFMLADPIIPARPRQALTDPNRPRLQDFRRLAWACWKKKKSAFIFYKQEPEMEGPIPTPPPSVSLLFFSPSELLLLSPSFLKGVIADTTLDIKSSWWVWFGRSLLSRTQY